MCERGEFQDFSFKFQDGRLPGFKLESSNLKLIHSLLTSSATIGWVADEVTRQWLRELEDFSFKVQEGLLTHSLLTSSATMGGS